MDTKQLRMTGLGNVKQNWGLSIGVALIVFLLAGWGVSFLPELDFTFPAELEEHFDWMREWNFRVDSFTVSFKPFASLGLVQLIIGGVIEMGYCIFLLKQHDGREPEFRDVFSMFDYFGTGFAQRFLRNLYVTLWSLLLVIPGIIASYSYAMTPYILAENPGLRANEAISRSKEMMDGYKGELFLLHLTFIGWDLLAVLTLNIGHLWLNPYKHAAEAAFYRQLQAKQQTYIA